MNPPKKQMSSVKGWLIRKICKKTRSFRYKNKSNTNITNTNTRTKNNGTKNSISRRNNFQRYKTTAQLTLDGTVVVYDDLKEYGHPYISTLANANTFRIHS